jgi:quercetin dioxygenase-like cupin family protein
MKRVVTGWNEVGDAVVLFEGEPPTQPDFGQARSVEIWSTDHAPARSDRTDDPTLGDFVLEPPAGGSICRLASYAPGATIPLHETSTVDYVVVVAGELTLLIGDRAITLEPGDVVVQQATPHGWENRGDVECVVAAVLLSSE